MLAGACRGGRRHHCTSQSAECTTVLTPVIRRRFPYPYKALLAISADVDSTSPWKFIRIHRFLNTLTPAIRYYGDGVGLDISDRFFFKTFRTMGSACTTLVTGTKMKIRGPMNSAAPLSGIGTRKMLEAGSPADWFSRRVPSSSKNTFSAGGSMFCMGAMETGASSPSSGKLATGAEQMDNIMRNGLGRGD